MAYEYLDQIGLSDEDKKKLKVLGAPTPASLLSRIEYSAESRQKFADYLGGEEKVSAIEAALRSLKGAATRDRLPPFKPGLGALDPGPAAEPSNAHAERDALIREIQDLRKAGALAEAEEKASHLRQLLKER
jgi:hypothetical protein